MPEFNSVDDSLDFLERFSGSQVGESRFTDLVFPLGILYSHTENSRNLMRLLAQGESIPYDPKTVSKDLLYRFLQETRGHFF